MAVQRQRGVCFAIAVLFLAAQVTVPGLGADVALGERVIVRLDADAYAAARRAGTLAAGEIDYGAFAWIEMDADEVARLEANRVPHEVMFEPFTLEMGGMSFDPLRSPARFPAGWEPGTQESPGLQLIQFAGPIRDEWLDGLEVVQYIHPFTYVVWDDPAVLAQRVQRDAAARWTGAFAPAYRVLPQWRSLPDEPVLVDVLVYRGAGEETTLRALRGLGGADDRYAVLNGTFGVATLTLPGSTFQAAARLPGVYSIQPEPTDGGLRGEMSSQVNANNLDGSGYAFPGYQAWLSSVGLSGAGVRIANVDSGVFNNHADLVNRLTFCFGTTCGGSATSNHGTHTAGIMAADGSSGTVDPRGFLRGLGVAPGAQLVEQVYSPYYTYPGGMLMLMTDSYRNDASLSGNSWGPSGTPVGYDNDTMQVDIGVRDADPDVPGNQPLSYVLSIMNGNGGTSSQGSPDEAKNIFTIGSTKMQNSDGSQILAINDLSSNSAHGPALDGRKIPHMVAPGCSVDSTVTSGYGTMCGTSMSSPQVSGAVALFIEYYRGLFGVDPTSALIKAAFLPVAHDLAGHLDADGGVLGHPFDSKQGWGRLDVEAVLDPQVPVHYEDNPYVFDQTGEVWQIELAAVDPAEPVRVMLVWTDAPGHGLGGSTPAWNNDLNLRVIEGSDTYIGNSFGADGWSLPSGAPDYMNNTEGIFLPAGTATAFEIQVEASNISSDGIPGQGDLTDQDFALVCYNCSDEGDFTVAVTPAALDVCLPETVTTTVDLGVIPPFQEVVTLTAGALPGVSATFTPESLTPPGQSLLTLVASGAPTGTHAFTISGTAASAVHTTTLSLSVSDGMAGVPLPTLPPSGAAGLSPGDVTLGWDPAAGATRYDVEVAGDPTFASPLVELDDVPGITTTLPQLPPAPACYFWRVAGDNGCGMGDWSTPSRFGTAAQGAAPAITAVEPAAWPAGEAVTVTVHGENLAPGPVLLLGDVPLTGVTWLSTETVTALVPGTLVPGMYDLTLYSADCQVAALARAFEVVVRPEFALSVNPSAFEVCMPALVTATVSVEPLSPELGVVTLTAPALPTGMSADFYPETVPAPGASVLTLTVAGATISTHELEIYGTAMWAVHTTTLSISVSDSIPSAPQPLRPSDGATGISPAAVPLAWESAGSAAKYDVEVAADPTFGAPILQVDDVKTLTYTLTSLPEAPACYFWRVAAENACGAGAWSPEWRFSTGEQGAAPAVHALEPDSAPFGEPVTVTVHGENLSPGSVVLLGEVALEEVTWVGSEMLTALVPGTLAPGTHDLTLYNVDCQVAPLGDAFAVTRPRAPWRVYLPIVHK